MKKLICILTCLVLAACVVACAKPTPKEEKKELAHREIPDGVEIMIIDDDGTVWLETEHVEGAYICYEESRGRFFELRVNENGQKQLKKAVRKKNRELSLVINGVIEATPVTRHEHYHDCIIYKDEYSEMMRCFNLLK